MTERLLMSPPDVGALEEQYVVAAIRSGWVAPTGPEVTAFEAEISAAAGVSHAVALSSGTAALHLAMDLVSSVRCEVVNQRFGAADFAEERLLQVMLRRDTNVGQPLVVGQSGNQRVQFGDINGCCACNAERTSVR